MKVIDKKTRYSYAAVSVLMIALSVYYHLFGVIELTPSVGMFPYEFNHPWLCLLLISSASIWINVDKWHNRDSLNCFAGACIAGGIMGSIFISPLLMLILGFMGRDAINGAKKCT